MGGKVQREKDLAEARQRRAGIEAAKKSRALRLLRNDFTVEEVGRVVGADRKTVKRWKEEMGNG